MLVAGGIVAATVGGSPADASTARHLSASPEAGRAESPVQVGLLLKRRHVAELHHLVRAVSDPASPEYRHFLTRAEYVRRFAAPPFAARTVREWLRTSGFSAVSTARDHGLVTAVAPSDVAAAAVERAPARVRREVQAVVGLTPSPVSPNAANPPTTSPTPCSTYYGQRTARPLPRYDGRRQPYAVCGYTPAQIQTAYGINNDRSGGAGASVGVVVVPESQTLASDVNRWSRDVGVPPMRNGQLETGPGLGRDTESNSTLDSAQDPGQIWAGEETMDVEAVHGLAPRARVLVYPAMLQYGVGEPLVIGMETILLELDQAVADDRAQVLSNSWGAPTGENVPSSDRVLLDRITDEATAEGITITFASGDSGDDYYTQAHHRAADFPGVSPGVTDVGGTTLEVARSGARIVETYWGSNSRPLVDGGWSRHVGLDGGGGGGVSTTYAEPAWQRGVVPRSEATYGGLSKPGRVVPDVAMDADPTTGLLVGQTVGTASKTTRYTESVSGGTSLACPLFAAVVALAVQRAGHGLGLITPTLYRAKRSARWREPLFYDPPTIVARPPSVVAADPYLPGRYELITGDNLATLHARAGFDDSTGLGSPNAPALIRALAGA